MKITTLLAFAITISSASTHALDSNGGGSNANSKWNTFGELEDDVKSIGTSNSDISHDPKYNENNLHEPPISPVMLKNGNGTTLNGDSNASKPLSSIIADKVSLRTEKLPASPPSSKSRKVYDYRSKPPAKFFQRKSYNKANSHLPLVTYQSKYNKLLFAATSKNNIGAIANILTKQADINAKLSPSGMTPLMLSASNGASDILKYFVLKGANLNAVNNQKQTALHICAQKRDYESLTLLISYGARTDVVDSNNKTAFDYLPIEQNVIFTLNSLKTTAQYNYALVNYASKGISDGIKMALVKGADINYKTSDGTTPLMVALQSHQDYQTIQLLLAKGANPFIPDSNHASALDYALLSQNPQLVNLVDTYATKFELENNFKRPESIYMSTASCAEQDFPEAAGHS